MFFYLLYDQLEGTALC